MQELKFFSNYIEKKYGKKLYRIPIDLGLGCPNRIDRFGDGCVFCAEDGSKARHLATLEQHGEAKEHFLHRQVAAGKQYILERYGDADGPYLAYFQSFTSTYAPTSDLKRFYDAVLGQADFKVLLIGTRPDALQDDCLELLKEYAKTYEVWLELGVQSAHDRTLDKIRRGHHFADVTEAMDKLRHYPMLHVAAHMILGLPGEEPADMHQSAAAIASLPFEAVKLHQLMILKNAPLGRHFRPENPPAKLLNEYEYAELAATFLHALPDHWLIMRLAAESTPELLIAPKWWMKKGQFLEFFKQKFHQQQTNAFAPVTTGDGSKTLYHPEFRQHFHSLGGAESESVAKFVAPSRLEFLLHAGKSVRLLDVGLGLGTNALAALECAIAISSGKLEITTLELDQRAPEAAMALFSPDTLQWQMLDSLLKTGTFERGSVHLRVIWGDARQTIKSLPKNNFDIIFQDGFSPDCNPELWSSDFVRAEKNVLKNNGVIVSYCSSYPYRGALLRNGFAVGDTPAWQRKRPGTIAARKIEDIETPLCPKEQGIIRNSTAGTPYRDRGLVQSRQTIFESREKLVKRLREHGVPKWFVSHQ